MNISTTGVIVSNDTHITHISNFHPYFVKLWFREIFIKFMTKNAVFCRLAQQELIVPYETSIFWSMSMWHKYKKKQLSWRNRISLTLARTLTLSIGERNFGNFTFSLVTTPRFSILRIWIHKKFWGGIQSLHQKSIWVEKLQLHEIDA